MIWAHVAHNKYVDTFPQDFSVRQKWFFIFIAGFAVFQQHCSPLSFSPSQWHQSHSACITLTTWSTAYSMGICIIKEAGCSKGAGCATWLFHCLWQRELVWAKPTYPLFYPDFQPESCLFHSNILCGWTKLSINWYISMLNHSNGIVTILEFLTLIRHLEK